MKLIIAIINHDDVGTVTQNLSKKGFSSTRLSTTGGYGHHPGILSQPQAADPHRL